MERVLEGVKVVEVSAWGFVPSCGAVLADWGADVIKVEPPTGDPMRGLISGGLSGGVSYPWEIWNRNKRSIGMDLSVPEARDLLLKLCEQADVFLTSYLPPTRQKLRIDIEDVQAVNPSIVYACGSGTGPRGEEANKGGFDAISFWARGGIAASTTPAAVERPVWQPSGGFGDSLSGMTLAGGIAAALLRRARTGEGGLVDVALLSTAMWSMQMAIVGGSLMAARGITPPPPSTGALLFNPLVNNYQTSDGRWLALCMLQRDLYWKRLCEVIGRTDLLDDSRFADAELLTANTADAVVELEKTFLTRPLAEWRAVLATQEGQWDVVATVLEVPTDPQAVANGYVQPVDYDGGVTLPLVAAPAQIDRLPAALGPAPAFNDHAEEILRALGLSEDQIIEAKIAGAVV